LTIKLLVLKKVSFILFWPPYFFIYLKWWR